MMEPIFSPQAQVVAWFKSDAIYDESGHPRAIVRDRNIYTLKGTHLGRMEHGYIRDHRGDAVAFLRGATGSPIVPTPRVIPTAPMTWPLRSAVTPRVTPYAPSPSTRWSTKDWEVFLSVEIDSQPGEALAASDVLPFVWF
jgi:hypothetical protein